MKITPKQQMLIVDFVAIAKANGATFIEAALPTSHPLMVSGKGVQMKAIRKVKDALARYNDELGNTVSLSVNGFIKQE